MSIISTIAVVLLIIFTGAILLFANKGLEDAAIEGEHFVDEWALRQERKLQRKGKNPFTSSNKAEEVIEKEEYLKGDYSEEEEGYLDQGPLAYDENDLWTLSVYDGEKEVKKNVVVDHLPYSMGRDPENDLVLEDLYVARFHVKLVWKDGLLVARDLGTANKIYAHGQICQEYIVKEDGEFYIGSYKIHVEKQRKRSQATRLAVKS